MIGSNTVKDEPNTAVKRDALKRAPYLERYTQGDL
jgi:hypothetical protein